MNEEKEDVGKIIKLILIKIGIKCDLIGFTFLLKSIEIVIKEPMLVYSLRKLFLKVGTFYGISNPLRIEANIQNAITLAYNTRGFSSVNQLYGIEIFKQDYKPTTAEIIKLVAEYYEMGLYKDAI